MVASSGFNAPDATLSEKMHLVMEGSDSPDAMEIDNGLNTDAADIGNDVEFDDQNDQSNASHSDSLDLPHIVGVEFPLIVKNPDRAVKMIGGKAAVSQAIENHDNHPLELRFSDDIFEHPISSRLSKNHNVMLKVTIPKEFLDKSNGNIQEALRLSREAQVEFKAKPCAVIDSTMRFREMSDFQYLASDLDFTKKFISSIASDKLEVLKNVQLVSSDSNTEGTSSDKPRDLLPPPVFSNIHYPVNYNYRQNPLVTVLDDGTVKSDTEKITISEIPFGDPIPSSTDKSTDKLSDQEKATLVRLREMFDDRPVWTRQALIARFGSPITIKRLQDTLPYIAFRMTTGPWRLSYIKLGVDVCSSNKYAKYQHISFKTVDKNLKWIKESDLPIEKSHIFDGVHLPYKMHVQICDVTDPDFNRVIETVPFNDKPDIDYGWYGAGFDKALAVIRAKGRALQIGSVLDESSLQEILRYYDNKRAKRKTNNVEIDKRYESEYVDDEEDDDDDEDEGDEEDEDDEEGNRERAEQIESAVRKSIENREQTMVDPELSGL